MSAIPPEESTTGEATSVSPEVPGATSDFADLTLLDVLAAARRAPRLTWRRFWEALNTPQAPAPVPIPISTGNTPGEAEAIVRRPTPAVPLFDAARALPLALMAAGVILGLLGSAIMASGTSRAETRELYRGAPWLLAGFVLWLAAGGALYRYELARWWTRRREGRAAAAVSAADSGAVRTGLSLAAWADAHAGRLALAAVGLVLSLATYLFNGGNTFTLPGVIAWAASIVIWLAALAPEGFSARRWLAGQFSRWRGLLRLEWRIRLSWTALALLGILAVGAYFRLAALDSVPPEMTSDHVEKLLDAQRVLDGTHQVFFPNNGGREPLQMYLVAIFSVISGLGMQFLTLKWVSALEGLITLPILWWMGREIIGEEQPRLGNAVGLLLAALVAVSYWHVALSRLALRIVLTPLVMALVLIFLARAMRHNRRADFLKAGVALGVGVYCYQAVRMVPVVVALGVALALIFRLRRWADRRRMLGNLAALAIISVVIFVPLGRFMVEYPNLFWMRTAGRLFGDDVIMETNPETGVITERNATLEDRLNAFNANLPVLGQNIRNALLMFNWKGDVAWINGAPNEPAMDPVAGTFLILGLAAWTVRLFRRRDVVDWLIVPALFIMLLPSALSIAFPVENPSATRTSGALPLAYLLVAYGMAALLTLLPRAVQRPWARTLSVGLAIVFLAASFSANSSLYFGEYRERYDVAAQPYKLTGRILRGFAESSGSYGNAFMVAYPYWFDHRAMGIEAGRIDWPNGLLAIDNLAQKIRENAGGPYAFDPERAVLFFTNAADAATLATLQEWFPEGISILQTTDYPAKDFYTFTAPPPGEAWLADFLAAHPVE